MAGLQYKFFPTDFYYPRPAQPTPVVESTTPSTVPIQKREAVVDDHGKQPAALVHRRNNNKDSVPMRRQGEKVGRIYIQNRRDQVKLPRNSLSWLILIPDEEHTDSSP